MTETISIPTLRRLPSFSHAPYDFDCSPSKACPILYNLLFNSVPFHELGEMFYVLEAEDPKKSKKLIRDKINKANDEQLRLIAKLVSEIV